MVLGLHGKRDVLNGSALIIHATATDRWENKTTKKEVMN